MHINGQPVIASGTLVIMKGQSGSISLPTGPYPLNFHTGGGAPSANVDPIKRSFEFRDFNNSLGTTVDFTFNGHTINFAVWDIAGNKVVHYTVI